MKTRPPICFAPRQTPRPSACLDLICTLAPTHRRAVARASCVAAAGGCETRLPTARALKSQHSRILPPRNSATPAREVVAEIRAPSGRRAASREASPHYAPSALGRSSQRHPCACARSRLPSPPATANVSPSQRSYFERTTSPPPTPRARPTSHPAPSAPVPPHIDHSHASFLHARLPHRPTAPLSLNVTHSPRSPRLARVGLRAESNRQSRRLARRLARRVERPRARTSFARALYLLFARARASIAE